MSATLDAATLALDVAQKYGLTTKEQADLVQRVSDAAVYTLEAGDHVRPILYVALSPSGNYSITMHRGTYGARVMYGRDFARLMGTADEADEFQPVQFVDVMRGDEYDPDEFEEVTR